MKTSTTTLDDLMESLSACIDVESAVRISAMTPPKKMQAQIDRLSKKCSEGTLTDQERSEYQQLVHFGTFVSMLKSRARVQMASRRGG